MLVGFVVEGIGFRACWALDPPHNSRGIHADTKRRERDQTRHGLGPWRPRLSMGVGFRI